MFLSPPGVSFFLFSFLILFSLFLLAFILTFSLFPFPSPPSLGRYLPLLRGASSV